MRALIITQFSEIGGTSRLHALQFLPYLERGYGIIPKAVHIYPDSFFRIQMGIVPVGKICKTANLFFFLAVGICKEIYLSLMAGKYDVVFIQRETFPKSIYWFLRIMNPRVVYQLEDAIYEISSFLAKNAFYRMLLKYRARLCLHMMDKAAWVIAENEGIAKKAREHNSRVTVISAPINSDRFIPAMRRVKSGPVTIGWVGTPATTKPLLALQKVFTALGKKYGSLIQLKVIGTSSDFTVSDITLVKKDWSFEDEVADLQSFDIGIMPVDVDDPFNKGRLGGKMIFYMMVSIPFVSTDAPLNRAVAEDGVHGFFVKTENEWIEKLSLLIDNPELRERMGKEGRNCAIERFSLESKIPVFASVLKNTAHIRM